MTAMRGHVSATGPNEQAPWRQPAAQDAGEVAARVWRPQDPDGDPRPADRGARSAGGKPRRYRDGGPSARGPGAL